MAKHLHERLKQIDRLLDQEYHSSLTGQSHAQVRKGNEDAPENKSSHSRTSSFYNFERNQKAIAKINRSIQKRKSSLSQEGTKRTSFNLGQAQVSQFEKRRTVNDHDDGEVMPPMIIQQPPRQLPPKVQPTVMTAAYIPKSNRSLPRQPAAGRSKIVVSQKEQQKINDFYKDFVLMDTDKLEGRKMELC